MPTAGPAVNPTSTPATIAPPMRNARPSEADAARRSGGEPGRVAAGVAPPAHADRGEAREPEVREQRRHREVGALGDDQIGEVRHRQHRRRERREEQGHERERERVGAGPAGQSHVERGEEHDGRVQVQHDRRRRGQEPQREHRHAAWPIGDPAPRPRRRSRVGRAASRAGPRRGGTRAPARCRRAGRRRGPPGSVYPYAPWSTAPAGTEGQPWNESSAAKPAL